MNRLQFKVSKTQSIAKKLFSFFSTSQWSKPTLKKHSNQYFNQMLHLCQLFFTLLHSNQLFCLSINERGTILDVTKNIERIVGYEPEELIGKNGKFYLHSRDKKEGYRFFFDMFHKDAEDSCILRIKNKENKWVWVKLIAIRQDLISKDPYIFGITLTNT